MIKNKKSICLIIAIVILLQCFNMSVLAEDTFYAKLSGIYDTLNTISVKDNLGDAAVYRWYIADTEDGKFSLISGQSSKSLYIQSSYGGKWIKATVSAGGRTVEADPRKIGEKLKRVAIYYPESTLYTRRNTPSDNIFVVDGKEFILLDVLESDESKFLVMSKNSLVKHKYASSGQKFDEMNAYLNGEFKEGGYLPDSILEHINYNAVWKMEPFMWPHEQDDETSVVAGISIPAVYEISRYIDKIGYYDEMGWWTRTPNGGKSGSGDTMFSHDGDITHLSTMWANLCWNEYGIRPIFYLNRDFFKEEKLDLACLGQNVRRAIANEYSDDEFSIYNEQELDILLRKGNITIDIHRLNDADAPYVAIEFSDKNDVNSEYVLSIASGDKVIKQVNINRGNYVGNTYKLSLDGIAYGTHDLQIIVSYNNQVVMKKDMTVVYMPFKKETDFMEFYSSKGYTYHPSSKNVIEFTDKSGITLIREGVEWQNIETSKGVYDFTRMDTLINACRDKNIEPIILLAYSHTLYGAASLKHGPSTKEQMDAFAAWAAAIAARYPDVKYFEVYNEPNLDMFWTPYETSHMDYSALLKITSGEIKKVNPDAVIVGGADTQETGTYIGRLYTERNVYPYLDAASFHPYYFLNGERVDDGYDKKLKYYTNRSLVAGGFKEQIITEVGWSTLNHATAGSDEDKQATELLKQYVVADAEGIRRNAIFSFLDGGFNKNDKEHNFGVITADGKPKKAYAALSGFNKILSGAVYCGEVSLKEGVKGFLYRRDGKPVLIMWNVFKKDDTVKSSEIAFEGEVVTAYDMYLNPTQKVVSTVTLGNEPMYVLGLSQGYFKEILTGYETEIDERLNALGLSTSNKTKLKSLFEDAISAVITEIEKTSQSEDDAYNLFVKHYETADKIIEAYNDKTLSITEKQLSGAMYTVYLTGMILANYYSVFITDGTASFDVDKTVENEINSLKAEIDGSVPHTQSILKTAKEIASDAKMVHDLSDENPSKAGFVKSREVVAEQLVHLAQLMKVTESTTHDEFVITAPSNNKKVTKGSAGEVEVAVYNYGNLDFVGELHLVNSLGNIIGSATVNVAKGQNVLLNVPVSAQYLSTSVNAQLEKNGTILKKVAITAFSN